jgi:hypothetical protein
MGYIFLENFFQPFFGLPFFMLKLSPYIKFAYPQIPNYIQIDTLDSVLSVKEKDDRYALSEWL